MSVSFDAYKTFYYVARYESITAAAQALYVTQPTVTHAVQALEKALGCQLFIRGQRGVSLTPEAEILYKNVSVACEYLFKAESRLAAAKQLKEGEIHIGASETTLHHYLLPLLKDFCAKYPDIKIKISNDTTPDTIAALKSSRLDFAILVFPPEQADSQLSIIPLTEFKDIVIAGNRFSQLKGRPINLAELAEYPLVGLDTNTITRASMDRFFLKHQLAFEPDIELATADLITPVVSNNLGIGFVPYDFAQSALSAGDIFQIQLKEKLPIRIVCFIHAADKPLSIAGQAFFQMLPQTIKNK